MDNIVTFNELSIKLLKTVYNEYNSLILCCLIMNGSLNCIKG